MNKMDEKHKKMLVGLQAIRNKIDKTEYKPDLLLSQYDASVIKYGDTPQGRSKAFAEVYNNWRSYKIPLKTVEDFRNMRILQAEIKHLIY